MVTTSEENSEHRQLQLQWFGPFFNGAIPKKFASGLYLLYVSNYPLFISSSVDIKAALNKHLFLSAKTIVPMDVRGREILHYAKLHNQPLVLKTGLCFQNGRLISPADNIEIYREAANGIAFCHALPCNRYASARYEFETTQFTCTGKFFPLKERFLAVQTLKEEPSDFGVNINEDEA